MCTESKVGWATGQLNSVHIHIYRYADLLLLLAEAQVEQGNLAAALALVNQVRTRAGQTAQGCGSGVTAKAESILVARYPGCAGNDSMAVPINDPVIKWATYKVGLYTSFPTQAFARNAVRIERKIELAMEGQRFFDLRRLIANACRESPWFATSTAFPVGVLISASPVTSSGARKPLSTAGTGVKWPCPSPLSHKPLPASARGVFGSASYRLPATIRSRLPSPSTSSSAIPLIGEICARLGSDDRMNVPSPVFCI